MRIALLQLNYTVGDLQGNAARVEKGVLQAKEKGARLVITSELALLGYLPRDLLLNYAFIEQSGQVLHELAGRLKGAPPLLIGCVEVNPSSVGRPLYNAAAWIQNGRIERYFHKTLLPTYDVFDEDRYFEPAKGPQILELKGKKLGISICEDVWNDRDFWERQRYHVDPIEILVGEGAQIIINMSASPFTAGKQKLRESMLGQIAAKHRIPLFYTNQVGGNDDLVFDGRSCVFDASGKLIARAKSFQEDVVVVDLENPKSQISIDDFTPEREIWDALVLGTRDYVRKCGFRKVLLGLSGGIDSAVTAAIATAAVGKENVLGVLMPSPYSSPGSIEDSLTVSRNLGIKTLTLPISDMMKSFDDVLEDVFLNYPKDVTEENIQARIRGNLLMALSNKYGALLLTTGNKSEIAVGYCTLYGDMSGGLAVISDVPKTMIYRLSRWLNRDRSVIPKTVIEKVPSAELRPNQTDQDSLPPYEILDAILERYIERHQSAEEMIQQGFEPETVHKVLHLVKRAEFKRKQAAPGLKVTDRAFGTGWRMPIACK